MRSGPLMGCRRPARPPRSYRGAWLLSGSGISQPCLRQSCHLLDNPRHRRGEAFPSPQEPPFPVINERGRRLGHGQSKLHL